MTKEKYNTEEKYNYEFIEIIVENMSGKPYYSIKYLNKDDGLIHVGYSSYKLNIISEFLKDYFMPTVEQKRGHWEEFTYNAPDGFIYPVMKCSCCGLMVSETFAEESNYCKNCGAQMNKELDKMKQIDRIHNMNVSELASFILWLIDECSSCSANKFCNLGETCHKTIERWLESEVTE